LSELWITFSLILVSLSAGYLYRFTALKREAARAEELRRKAATIQKGVITMIYPVTLTITFWNMKISSGTLALFPLFGVCSHFMGGLFAVLISRCLHHSRSQTGAMLTAGAFTNLGSFGGLVSYMYLGEAGYALATLFRLFESVIYYSIGFPLARLYSSDTPPGTKWRFDLRALTQDPLFLFPIGGILLGTLLNWSGLPRPELLGALLSPLVMASTTLMLISVGLNMRFSAIGSFLREAIAVAGIKHLLLPALLVTLGLLAGYGRLNGGLPLRVLIIVSSMPVAINSLIPPTLYKLDLDLANSCWILSNGIFVVAILPLLYLVKVF
jgi:predicted permease